MTVSTCTPLPPLLFRAILHSDSMILNLASSITPLSGRDDGSVRPRSRRLPLHPLEGRMGRRLPQGDGRHRRRRLDERPTAARDHRDQRLADKQRRVSNLFFFRSFVHVPPSRRIYLSEDPSPLSLSSHDLREDKARPFLPFESPSPIVYP